MAIFTTMNLLNRSSRIIVTCSNRLSTYVEKEVLDLGFTPVRVFKTGVELQGKMKDCIRLNLNLRVAGQVLFSLNTFRARDAEELYRQLIQVEWEKIIPAHEYFSISSHVKNDSITNQLYANVKVKDAIADRFREKTGQRPDSGPELSGVVIHLFWMGDEAEIFLDTTGETLSKHGYRKIPGKAPMIESLAAATIMASRWDRKSPFINPMCGSGTLAIEAALLATKRAPGLLRDNYSFMHTCEYDGRYYESEKQQLEQQVIVLPKLPIIASDISEDAVQISRINARMAGVEDMIEFKVCDFEETGIPEDASGAVFFNPEYGDRLGEEIELQPTYRRMGDFLKKKCKGYYGYIFTGNLELAKHIGLKPKRRIEFYNGKIDCRLLEYELYAGSRKEPS